MHDLVYRHTDDMIHKLESAGLGYHVKTDESDDRLGMNLSSFFLAQFVENMNSSSCRRGTIVHGQKTRNVPSLNI